MVRLCAPVPKSSSTPVPKSSSSGDPSSNPAPGARLTSSRWTRFPLHWVSSVPRRRARWSTYASTGPAAGSSRSRCARTLGACRGAALGLGRHGDPRLPRLRSDDAGPPTTPSRAGRVRTADRLGENGEAAVRRLQQISDMTLPEVTKEIARLDRPASPVTWLSRGRITMPPNTPARRSWPTQAPRPQPTRRARHAAISCARSRRCSVSTTAARRLIRHARSGRFSGTFVDVDVRSSAEVKLRVVLGLDRVFLGPASVEDQVPEYGGERPGAPGDREPRRAGAISYGRLDTSDIWGVRCLIRLMQRRRWSETFRCKAMVVRLAPVTCWSSPGSMIRGRSLTIAST